MSIVGGQRKLNTTKQGFGKQRMVAIVVKDVIAPEQQHFLCSATGLIVVFDSFIVNMLNKQAIT